MLRYHESAAERISEIKRDMKGGQELTQDRSRGEVSGERRVEIHKLTSEPPRKDRIGKWRKEMDPGDLGGVRIGRRIHAHRAGLRPRNTAAGLTCRKPIPPI